MNSKLLYGAALSALALTACSNEEVVQVRTDAISFAVTNGATTRAYQSHCNSNLPGSFKVSAQFADGTFYFQGDDATRNGESTTYTSSPERWWPEEGNLTFHAWANDQNTYAFDEANNKAQFVNFTPNADVKEQRDLLYGVATNQNRADGNVKLNFRHALSQIVFSARSEATSYQVAVKGVSVGHLNDRGTFTFGGESTAENYQNHTDVPNGNEDIIKGGAGLWALNGALQTYSTSFDKTSLDNNTVELTSVNHNGGADGSLLLLPQTQHAWTPGVASTEAADAKGFKGAYFLLDVELTTKEGVALYTGQMAVPVEIAWEQGTRYRYTFIFTDGNGGWTADPENPQPVLGGIKYDVTTDDFVPVNGGEVYPGNDPRPDADKYAYTLNFNANGGEGTMESAIFNNVAYTSQSFVVPANAFTYADHEFTGWNTAADGTGTPYIAGATLTLNGVAGQNVSATLYAQWRATAENVVLTFDTNGEGTIAPMTVKVNVGEQATFKLPAVTLSAETQKSYKFLGWMTEQPANKILKYNDATPAGIMYATNPDGYKFAKSTKLYAVYRETSSGSANTGHGPAVGD